MAYKVINEFKDTDGHVYKVGKPYPKSGKGTKKRLEELSQVHSKYKVAFIEKVEKDKE
ncbi:termination factor Rho [Bacillus sp. B-jedd]|uniref:termination factor Rho n=1 Tax=Bacillus sp. B-jedd TaxID=1476857 RepID=UPI000515585B|nr:termination factor Rho [Bacillus sp. B-jedd]CEG28084.1 hypothetical protein BN1002_02963 [Bacillus sp. B-jedd]